MLKARWEYGSLLWRLPKKLLPYGLLSKQGRRIHFYTNLMCDASVELQCLLYFYASGSGSWAPYGHSWAFLAQEQGSNVGFNWGVDEQPHAGGSSRMSFSHFLSFSRAQWEKQSVADCCWSWAYLSPTSCPSEALLTAGSVPALKLLLSSSQEPTLRRPGSVSYGLMFCFSLVT